MLTATWTNNSWLFYLNLLLFGYDALWLSVVFVRRRAQRGTMSGTPRDLLAGDYLALGTILVFTGFALSGVFRIIRNYVLPTTPFTPIVTAGLIVIIVAQIIALRRTRKQRKRDDPDGVLSDDLERLSP